MTTEFESNVIAFDDSTEPKCAFCSTSKSDSKMMFNSTVIENMYICGNCVVKAKSKLDNS